MGTSCVQESRNASGSTRGPRAKLEVRLADLSDVSLLPAAQWDALSANALDPNPFYSRRYVAAGLATIDRDAPLRALTIYRADGTLVGLFPHQLARLPVETALGASNIYQMSGHPLIHRDHATEVVAAWFEAMRSGQVPRRWRFPHIDLESGFARRCRRQLAAARFEIRPLARYGRPRLRRLEGGFELHVDTVLSRRRARDIQRTLRRLREVGQVEFERARTPDLIRQRIEDFLVMEHAGWKGEAGTSFLSNPDHAAFLREALGGNECVSIDSLLLDGRPIAVSINLEAAGTLFTPKCAFDETYRRFSPGLVLEYLVIQAFYERSDAMSMDAATTASGHVVQGLWNEERTMATVLVGPDDAATKVAAQTYLAATQAKSMAKAVIGGQLVAAFRRMRRISPDIWRRLTSLGQSATCLLLYI